MGKLTFRGGIHPYEGKELSKDHPIEKYLPKGDLVYPLSQHIGAPSVPCVQKGDTVLAGQKIADAGGFVSVPLHASVSGTVKGIEKHLNATGSMVDCIVIENDQQYQEVEYQETRLEDLTKEEILSAALFAAENGYGSICLQAGERNDPKFVSFISECLREIHRKTVSKNLPNGLGITLSLGDQTKDVYEEWAQASGNRKNLRYLARFESSNHELFDFLHNVPHKKSKQLEHRLQCLQWLKECGYQVGTGVMIGIPGQTLKDLCADIRLFQKLEADMIGMGPYLMSEGGDLKSLGQTENKQLFQLSLNMIAVTRLVMGNINIAAATAMQVLDPQGRETAISYGANVVMPNLTPLQYREGYQLYDKKPGLKDDPETFGLKLEERIQSKGREVGWNLSGSSRKWLNRTGNSQEGYDGNKSASAQSMLWIKSTES